LPVSRTKIAIFAGATATVLNTEPLVTSNKARRQYGLPLRLERDGTVPRFDALRPQRLAAPVTVLIEQHSAHPLEADAAELYAPPDGYVDGEGRFSPERHDTSDVPVYRVVLEPGDGLYALPYMARQANGGAWDGDVASDGRARQPFFADSARLVEEIDRFGIGDSGHGNLLSAKADFDHIRVAPSGGYTKGLPAAQRTDVGGSDLAPEERGRDFFPYRPYDLRTEPDLSVLAHVTNVVQAAMASGAYAGAVWLEGTPFLEETLYWLNLVIDTSVPIVGVASHRAHGAISNDGDRNLVDAVDYIVSRVWADDAGHDRVGVVAVLDEVVYTARELQKGDARPGGYVATGGHGGIVGRAGRPGAPVVTFVPNRRHTATSLVKTSAWPAEVPGASLDGDRAIRVPVRVRDADGALLAAAVPHVAIVKHARYLPPRGGEGEPSAHGYPEIDALVAANLRRGGLAGFVVEGAAPYGRATPAAERALRRAALQGMPVAMVGRGNAEGFVPPGVPNFAIAGSNLTATKARLLLMACLLRFGAPPPARDPDRPSDAERAAVHDLLERYRAVFADH
jgi:L-asparaginase